MEDNLEKPEKLYGKGKGVEVRKPRVRDLQFSYDVQGNVQQ